SEALWSSATKAYNFDAGTVTLVNMGPAEMITAFVRGDTEAVVLWEPHSTKARKLGDGKTLISGTTSFIGNTAVPRRVYGDHSVLFATESTLKEQPAVTRALIGALQKANDFIENNRAEAVAIL